MPDREERQTSESEWPELNRLKRVSPVELQRALAEAASRLFGEEHTVSITSMTFKTLGATVTMEIGPRLRFGAEREPRGGAERTGGTGSRPPQTS